MSSKVGLEAVRSLTCSVVVCSREGRAHLDTTNTFAFLNSELDVALITPPGVPRVLDQPVLLAVLSAVADSKHCVVEISAAAAAKDTGTVSLEGTLVGLNDDREGLLSKGSFHLRNVIWFDGLVVLDIGARDLLGALEARGGVISLTRGVRVLNFLNSLVECVIVVGAEWISTLAAKITIVTGSTVNELLLRERLKITLLDEMGAFESTSRRE